MNIHRSGTRGHKFAVTLADLRKHRIYDEVFEEKDSKTLEPNLRRLKGREWVKAVCMDLSLPFRSILRMPFPESKDRCQLIFAKKL